MVFIISVQDQTAIISEHACRAEDLADWVIKAQKEWPEATIVVGVDESESERCVYCSEQQRINCEMGCDCIKALELDEERADTEPSVMPGEPGNEAGDDAAVEPIDIDDLPF